MGVLADLKDSLCARSGGEGAAGSGKSPWGRPQRGISLKLVVLGVVGLLIFFAASLFGGSEGQLPPGPETQAPEAATKVDAIVTGGEITELQRFEQNLSAQLAQILSQVQGAGAVTVYVSLASGPEYDYAHNQSTESRITEERDTNGGQRVIQETREDNQLVMVASRQGTHDGGLVRKELHPPVQGVLVVAEGAENSQTKAELIRATQVVLGIGSHQVVVLAKER